MEEKITRKQIIPLVIGVLTLVILVVSATYAYFSVTSTKSAGTTTITGDIGGDTLGTVTLSGGNTNLYLEVSAYDMSLTNKGTTYYSSTTEGSRETSLASAGKTTYTATLTGDNTLTYACDYEFTVTSTGSMIGQTSSKDLEMVFEGDIEKIINLTGSDEISGTWYGIKGSDATRTFNAYLQLTNTDDVQNDIAGTDLSVEITNTNWNCYLSEVEELKGEAYALYTADNSTLTFVRSETPYEVGGTYNDKTITSVYTGFETETYTSGYSNSTLPWYEHRSNILNIVFADIIRPVSTAHWFNFWYTGTQINMDIQKLDTSNVTNMDSMFVYRNINQIIGLEDLDVSNVTSAEAMFMYATINTSIDLSRWDVSKLTNVYDMFRETTLTNVNLSNWNLQSAMSLSVMFEDSVLTNVNMSNWNTSNITDMSRLFRTNKEETKLIGVNVSNWDTSNVTDMSSMFSETIINSITGLDTWNTSSLSNMSSMFQYATINANIGIEGWNTSSVTDMSWMFGNATLNVDLNLSGWNVNITEPANFSTNISGTGTLTPPTWKTA